MSSETSYLHPSSGGANARLSLVDVGRDGDTLTCRVMVDWRPTQPTRPWRQLFDAVMHVGGALIEARTVPVAEDEDPRDVMGELPAHLIAGFLREAVVHARLACLLQEASV